MFLELNKCSPAWTWDNISILTNYISELRMANKNILSQYNFSRLLAVKIIFTWFSPIIRDQGCVKAEKAFYYIMYWFMAHVSHLRCGDHSCFLKYRSSVKSPRTYYKMEKKWLFFNDTLQGLVALPGREGFKASSSDIHRPSSFIDMMKQEAIPLASMSLHLDGISIQ